MENSRLFPCLCCSRFALSCLSLDVRCVQYIVPREFSRLYPMNFQDCTQGISKIVPNKFLSPRCLKKFRIYKLIVVKISITVYRGFLIYYSGAMGKWWSMRILIVDQFELCILDFKLRLFVWLFTLSIYWDYTWESLSDISFAIYL